MPTISGRSTRLTLVIHRIAAGFVALAFLPCVSLSVARMASTLGSRTAASGGQSATEFLSAEQVVPGAPYQIRAADLQANGSNDLKVSIDQSEAGRQRCELCGGGDPGPIRIVA